MSPAVSAHIASIATTKLLFSRPASACVRLQIGAVSHDIALACSNGRFLEMTAHLEAVLQAWFYEVTDRGTAGKTAQVIAGLIRDRHERQLVQPPDPRRLPLSLPAVAKGESTWRTHRRPMAGAR